MFEKSFGPKQLAIKYTEFLKYHQMPYKQTISNQMSRIIYFLWKNSQTGECLFDDGMFEDILKGEQEINWFISSCYLSLSQINLFTLGTRMSIFYYLSNLVWMFHPGLDLLMLIQIARNSKHHLTERTLVWFFSSMAALWKVNSWDDLNDFWQKEHWNGFSPVWLRVCLVKSPNWVNAFWQMEHWNSFSPVCMHVCIVKLPNWVNAFWQKQH